MARVGAEYMTDSPVLARRSLQGVTQIIRYNWTYYVVALIALAAGSVAASRLPLPASLTCILWLALGLTAFWTLSSILVSFYAYDCSPLYKWQWLRELFESHPQAWVNVHAGLDETTAVLRALFPASTGRIFDIYDPGKMTERSIERARQSCGTIEPSEKADFTALPIGNSECDAVFLIFAAHEIRDSAGRLEFFKELRRILKPGAKLVLVEHLRDAWNFGAYGPGFWHFYSRAEWVRSAENASLSIHAERSITPFVRCLVFVKAANA